MTPKEKAHLLYSKYWLLLPARYVSMKEEIERRAIGRDDKSISKQCAIIAVAEIIESCDSSESEQYWYHVKEEIEKL